jgi:hypothetical protein
MAVNATIGKDGTINMISQAASQAAASRTAAAPAPAASKYTIANDGTITSSGSSSGSGSSSIISAPQTKYDPMNASLMSQLAGQAEHKYVFPIEEPSYYNQYDTQTKKELAEVLNRAPFSYDAASDPAYQQYLKTYLREGDNAMRDVLAQTSRNSAGLPSSYAVSAASQARNNYAAQASDKLPEMLEAAYAKYLQEDALNRSDVGLVNQQEQYDFSKFLTELGQWNTDRSFDYGVFSDQFNRVNQALNQSQNLSNTEYSRNYQERTFAFQQQIAELERQGAISSAEAAAAQQEFENQLALEKLMMAASQNDFDNSIAQEKLLLANGFGYDASGNLVYLGTGATASGGGSYGSGTASGSKNWSAAYQEILTSGMSVSNWLANNKKSWGIGDYEGDFVDGYEAWKSNVQQQIANTVIQMKSSSTPKNTILSYLKDALESKLINSSQYQGLVTLADT